MATEFKSGDHVKHVINYVGAPVVGVITHISVDTGPSWERTFVYVRWVKPDGNPDSSPEPHDPSELVLSSREESPASFGFRQSPVETPRRAKRK